MTLYLCLTLCACAGGESDTDAAVRLETGESVSDSFPGTETGGADEGKESEPSGRLPSETLAEALLEHRTYNKYASYYLPDWAYAILQKELAGCLADVDSGEYTYRLKAVVICNTEDYFSMAVQGSRSSADTEKVEDVAFCVNLDMKKKCVMGLADYLELEVVKEAFEEGEYVLTEGTEFGKRAGTDSKVIVFDPAAEADDRESAADPSDIAGWKEACENLVANIDNSDHYYDYYINRDSSVGILLPVRQGTDSLVIMEMDADWFAAWRELGAVKEAQERILDMYLYEVRSDAGREYVAITGVKEEYREGFWERWHNLDKNYGKVFRIPNDIEGIRVEEIGADAFNGIRMEEITLKLPESIRIIGERAFLNTGISWISFPVTWHYGLGASIFPEGLEQIGDSAFEGCKLEKLEFFGREAVVIGERAFADNQDLRAVYVPTVDCVIGKDAFAGCEDPFYLVYGENVDGRENLVEAYAEQSGLTALEYIPARLEVNYPETPLVLTPEVSNFFYGENGEGDNFDSFERSEDAPDYGFEEWHAPCGEFCAGECYINMEASSELASWDGRYSAENLKYWGGRSCAWAEGVEGTGIGESITYNNYNQWNSNDWLDFLWRWQKDYSGTQDGYMRYTEICIVNGYAKSQKTWEENGRVKRLLMYVEDRPYAYLELEDTILPQYFTLPEGDIKSADGGDITFRFVIEDVYPGTVYEDTCLTGLVLDFTGRHGH